MIASYQLCVIDCELRHRMVALLSKQMNPPQYFCGGSLISANKVLTAAHCLWNKNQPKMLASEVIVKLGAHNLSDPYETNTFIATPAEIMIHDDWNATSGRFNDDIAMITLESQVAFSNYIKPICIANIRAVREAVTGVAIGWGKSDDDSRTYESIPRKAELPITANEECYRDASELARMASPKTFCAGSSKSRVCLGELNYFSDLDRSQKLHLVGDSGNGFFIFHNGRYYLKGIVSATYINQSNRPCDAINHALFTEVLKYLVGVKSDSSIQATIAPKIKKEPTESPPTCGIMSEAAGLVQRGFTATRKQFPWIVPIFTYYSGKFKHFGSGSLISMKHVLTAAIFAAIPEPRTNKLIALPHNHVKLYFGMLHFSEASTHNSVEVSGDGIEEIIVHPNAVHGGRSYLHVADIAIISLKNRLLQSEFISPVCLWHGSDDISDINGFISYGVGYGSDVFGDDTETREYARMFIQSNPYCRQFYGSGIDEASQSQYFCAQGDGAATPCKKDIPLYMKVAGFWYIRGMSVMFKLSPFSAFKTCDEKRPMLYEDLAFYQSWIVANMKF